VDDTNQNVSLNVFSLPKRRRPSTGFPAGGFFDRGHKYFTLAFSGKVKFHDVENNFFLRLTARDELSCSKSWFLFVLAFRIVAFPPTTASKTCPRTKSSAAAQRPRQRSQDIFEGIRPTVRKKSAPPPPLAVLSPFCCCCCSAENCRRQQNRPTTEFVTTREGNVATGSHT